MPSTPSSPLLAIGRDLAVTHFPQELEDHLTRRLTLANPKWVENNRMGRWNRDTPKTLHFYERIGSTLHVPRGMTREVISWCRGKGVDYRIEDRRRRLPEVAFSFTGALRDFQKRAVAAMLPKSFGTLTAPTGSGKTVMALYMIATRRQPALIVVHTRELALQWMDRIEHFLQVPEAEIGLVGAGKERVGEKITVALVQSLVKRTEQVTPRIGYLVVDECHRCPSRTFTEAVSAFDSQFMTGLSATPWRRDGLSRLIFWYLGDMHHEVDKAHLVRSGDVMAVEVRVRETDFKPSCDPVQEYPRMLRELTQDDERNRLIVADVAAAAKADAGVCLVLSDRKKHCETLRALLRYRHGVFAELLTGDLSESERRAVLERVNAGYVRVLVATGQLVGEGLDAPGLSTLFLATPIRFSGRLIQYLGRVLRPAPGKKVARVVDYVDSQVPTLVAAAEARQRVYREPLGP